ncbi:Mitochondrial translocator assembly and maintenance protein 41 [Coemansia sp. RSA 1933]|nr:Mitochondrial translocator assembly and maintenance protein 41 [Coemansia sp. RSA 1933]
MSQLLWRSSSSAMLCRRSTVYKTASSVACQVRWESRLEANAKAGEEIGGSGDRSATDAETAALFLARRQQGKTLLGGGVDNRQTARPPQPSAEAQRSAAKASLVWTQRQTTGGVEKGGGGMAKEGMTVSGVIPELTESEELQLEEMLLGQKEIREQLSEVLGHFGAPIRYAFAYGSGVYKQTGYGAGSKPMVDLIFAVSHPDHWHALNISQNRSHYSFMGTLGSNAVAFVQDRMGAGVYYNAFVELNGVMIKYGVVSMDALGSDLLNWDSLYLAGRMHKPTLTLRRDPLMRISKQVNLTHAVRAALLMLPKNFGVEALFRTIASLSFAGDFRMKIGGENPNKVHNIVEAQLPLFKTRYSSIIEGLPNLEFIGPELLQQDMNPKARAAMLRKMPNNFYAQLVRQGRKSGAKLPPGLGAETVNTERLVAMENVSALAHKAIEKIVARPALTQSVKGILSSGLTKSISYMYAKNSKYREAAE